MSYTDESNVYNTTGLSSDIIQDLGDIPESEVTTFVESRIARAEKRLKEDINLPYIIKRELHLGDGNKNQWDLGPEDDPYSTLGDFDPDDCLEKILRVEFAGYRRLVPWPKDCDTWTNYSDMDESGYWTGSNATISEETTIKVAGARSLKAVFSASGYIRYPSTQDLDKIIDSYNDIFFWLKTSSIGITITVRLYDKDGNYEEETISPRQADVGQYFWIDINKMTDTIDWDNTYLQYIEFRVSGACTIYLDNLCFAEDWAFTAPEGTFHVSVADNISTEAAPSVNYPFYVTYSYDPFLSSTPEHIAEATEWLTGVLIIDYLRTIKYIETDFRLWSDTMEQDIPMQRSGMLGIRTKFLDNYKACLLRYGGASYGIIM